MTTSARATAIGAMWNYGAQTATVVAQLGYAAVSSRLLGPAAFGEYGVALLVGALVTLVATAGLPQAAARMAELDSDRLAGLLRYALGVGVGAAVLVLVTADAWAALWGVPSAGSVIRVLAIGTVFGPVLALGTGVLLRGGRFRHLAVTTLACNVTGMAVGLVAIEAFRTPETLVVSPVVAQALTALVCWWLTRRLYRGRPSRSALRADVTYSGALIVSSLLSYAAGNVPKLALGRTFGGATLGHWNRAEVLTAVPFFQVQNALVQALNPEFRHDIGTTERAQRVWADLLGLVAWLCLPAAAVLAVVSPVMVDPLFGPGWADVARLTPALAVLAGLQALCFVLVGALEVLGRFGWMWTGYVVAVLVNATGGVVAWRAHDLTPLLVAIVVAWLLMHAVHVGFCHRAGLVRGRVLAGRYGEVLVTSGLLAAAAYAVVHAPALADGRPWFLPLLVLVLAVAAVLTWRLRDRLPVVVLARKYGLLGG